MYIQLLQVIEGVNYLKIYEDAYLFGYKETCKNDPIHFYIPREELKIGIFSWKIVVFPII